MSFTPTAGAVYGGEVPGEGCEVVSVQVSLDRDGNPQADVYFYLGSVCHSPLRPEARARRPCPRWRPQPASGSGRGPRKRATTARNGSAAVKASISAVSHITGEKLEDTPDVVARLTEDHPQSLLPKIIGKKVYTKGTENQGKVYLNVNVPAQQDCGFVHDRPQREDARPNWRPTSGY
jgi:hypothetical protein